MGEQFPSTHPYLIRAIHAWAADNNLTPYLLVDTTIDGVEVPKQFIQDNAIVLNLSQSAVRDLSIGDEYIAFNARFAGVVEQIFVPIIAVRAIYAKENGDGVILPSDDRSIIGNVNRAEHGIDASRDTDTNENGPMTHPALTDVSHDNEGPIDVKDVSIEEVTTDSGSKTDQKNKSKTTSKPHLKIVE